VGARSGRERDETQPTLRVGREREETRQAIRVGLARTEPHYRDLVPPYGPGKPFPELAALLGDTAAEGPPNHVYAAVRGALRALGLDAARFDTPGWNPLGSLVARGGRVVLKPNFIRHWNPDGQASVESVVTHGAMLRAAADYALLAVGLEGSLMLAEAPQHDCDWESIAEIAGLDALVRFYADTLGLDLPIIDLRREAVTYDGGVIATRQSLPGDPAGYRLVDLGAKSCFEGSGLDPARFRGADYDPGPTTAHHTGGRNEYLLSESVLRADLVVNLPKLKTHKKTGVTLAMKNLVGINGDKNLLPHHCVGSDEQGGDEFPGSGWLDRARSRASERARGWLARGVGLRWVRLVRRVESRVRGDDFIRSGNWHGNRTTWRMCLDLNRCFYYSDASGQHFDATSPVRRALTLMDGIVAGDGNGPLAPRDVPLGVVLAATDPVALDLAALRLMGFDWRRIPKICEAMRADTLRITQVRDPADVVLWETEGGPPERRKLEEIHCATAFEPHPGWRDHIESTTRDAA
jgi:uncharacterized protein (DUF362 family)